MAVELLFHEMERCSKDPVARLDGGGVLARSSDPQSGAFVRESFLGLIIIQASLPVAVQGYEGIVVCQPTVVVSVDERITLAVGDLEACCQADTSIEDVEDDVLLVEHQIYLTFLAELAR